MLSNVFVVAVVVVVIVLCVFGNVPPHSHTTKALIVESANILQCIKSKVTLLVMAFKIALKSDLKGYSSKSKNDV